MRLRLPGRLPRPQPFAASRGDFPTPTMKTPLPPPGAPSRLRRAFRQAVLLAPLAAVDTLVTDSGLDAELAEEIENAGPHVVRA